MLPLKEHKPERYQFSWFDGLTVALAGAILGEHKARYAGSCGDAIRAALWMTKLL